MEIIDCVVCVYKWILFQSAACICIVKKKARRKNKKKFTNLSSYGSKQLHEHKMNMTFGAAMRPTMI